jgi:hypothetical protein
MGQSQGNAGFVNKSINRQNIVINSTNNGFKASQ